MRVVATVTVTVTTTVLVLVLVRVPVQQEPDDFRQKSTGQVKTKLGFPAPQEKSFHTTTSAQTNKKLCSDSKELESQTLLLFANKGRRARKVCFSF